MCYLDGLFAKHASAMAGISPLLTKYTIFKLDKLTANLMEMLFFLRPSWNAPI
jgi:hypothetical protein